MVVVRDREIEAEPLIKNMLPPRSATSSEAVVAEFARLTGRRVEKTSGVNLLPWEAVTANFFALLPGRENGVVRERIARGEEEFDGVVYNTKSRELAVNNQVMAARTDYEEKGKDEPLNWNQASFVPSHTFTVSGSCDKTLFMLRLDEFVRGEERVHIFTYQQGDSKPASYCGGCPLSERTQQQIAKALGLR